SFSFDEHSNNSQIAALFTSNYNNNNNNNKQTKIKIKMKLQQRPTIQEMRSRGILFDHPNISPQLIARAIKRARDKAKHILRAFLTTRPNVRELQNKNILIHVEAYTKHKRELSADLQHKIRMRPSLQDTPQANGG
ncbi:hypothetical protein RFI_34676, partial [Reticulomyxa filosa]